MKKVLFSALAVMALTASVFAAGVRTKTTGPTDGLCVPTIPVYDTWVTTTSAGQTYTTTVIVGYRC